MVDDPAKEVFSRGTTSQEGHGEGEGTKNPHGEK